MNDENVVTVLKYVRTKDVDTEQFYSRWGHISQSKAQISENILA